MMQLRPYQCEAVTAIRREWLEGRRRTLLVLPTGCHAVGQRLLMYSGETRAVEDIRIGDKLMGMDGTPRTVLHVTTGTDTLYTVMPRKGDPFTVTGDHQLTLVRTNEMKHPQYPCQRRGGEIIDVSVREWLGWSKNQKHLHKLVRCSGIAEFGGHEHDILPIDPYFLGILLGDGGLSHGINITTADPEVVEVIKAQAEHYGYRLRHTPAGKADTWFFCKNRSGGRLHGQLDDLGLLGHTSAEKFVPNAYKFSSARQRLEILAGLIDSDGYVTGQGIDYITKSRQLSEDIAFICRSVGLAVHVSWCFKTCMGKIGDYYRLSISGNCDRIPCRVARRKSGQRKQIKNVLRTGFSITEVERGDYIGFTVDGDNRYLLDDFTVTHNCGKTVVMAAAAAIQPGRLPATLRRKYT